MLCPFCQRPVEQFLPPPDGGHGLRCPLCNEEGVPTLYPGDYDRHPAVPVCIFGPTGHGKTVFIEALITHLEEKVPWPDFAPQWMDQAGMRATRQRLQLLREHGQLPDATAAVFPRPQVIRLRNIPRVGGCQLLFYDTSGETFGDIELLKDRGRYVRNSPAVLWLVSLAELEYPQQLTDLMTIYAESMAGMGANPKSQIVIVALTKGDLLIDRPDFPAEAKEFLLNDNLDPAQFTLEGDPWRRLEAVSSAIETWMKGTPHRRIVALLKEQFKTVRFCVLSSQGAAAQDQVLQMELLPRGVLAPLFWLWRETLPVAWVELGGAKRFPFFSLQEALSRAPAGATVRLGPHTYTLPAPLKVQKPVAIVGAGAEQTIIRCAAEGFVFGTAAATGEVSVSGASFVHTGTEAADVVLARSGTLTLSHCTIRGGITVKDRSAKGDGLRAVDEAVLAATHCRIEQNQGSGVSGRDKVRIELKECSVRNNGLDGVHVAGGRAVVQRCTLVENLRSGVHCSGSVRAAVADSTCAKNGRNGIAAFLDAAVELLRNTCEQNVLDGIVLKDRVAVKAFGNTSTKNQQAGISIHDSVSGEVSDNAAHENALSGIECEDEAHPDLCANRSAKNRGSGINYSGSARGRCSANTCTQNFAHGIAIAGKSAPDLDGNTSSGNRGAGYWIADLACPTFGKDNGGTNNERGEFLPPKWGKRGWFG